MRGTIRAAARGLRERFSAHRADMAPSTTQSVNSNGHAAMTPPKSTPKAAETGPPA